MVHHDPAAQLTNHTLTTFQLYQEESRLLQYLFLPLPLLLKGSLFAPTF